MNVICVNLPPERVYSNVHPGRNFFSETSYLCIIIFHKTHSMFRIFIILIIFERTSLINKNTIDVFYKFEPEFLTILLYIKLISLKKTSSSKVLLSFCFTHANLLNYVRLLRSCCNKQPMLTFL